MFDSALKLISEINVYSITLIIILCLLLLTKYSNRFKEGAKFPLQICAVIWLIFFGYKVYTGDNLYYALTSPSDSDIEKERYKKTMIDGREVIYDETTGEIVNRKKKE